MAKHPPDDKLVYLASRSVFTGENAHIRRGKAIKSLIQQNQPVFADLLREHDIESLCSAVKALLKDQVFESTLNAKLRFPEVFKVPHAKGADQKVSGFYAAQKGLNTVKRFTKRPTAASGVAQHDHESPHSSKEQGRVDGVSGPSDQPEKSTPCLYPVVLPDQCQHRLMAYIQAILEEACFEFMKNHSPQTLNSYNLECPESGELTKWLMLISHHWETLVQGTAISSRNSVKRILQPVRELRNTAVHRNRKTAIEFERLVENAHLFLELLHDHSRFAKVTQIREELQLAVEELTRNKDRIEARCLDQLHKTISRRENLNRSQQKAITNMLDKDRECLSNIGADLEQKLLCVQQDTVAKWDEDSAKIVGSVPVLDFDTLTAVEGLGA